MTEHPTREVAVPLVSRSVKTATTLVDELYISPPDIFFGATVVDLRRSRRKNEFTFSRMEKRINEIFVSDESPTVELPGLDLDHFGDQYLTLTTTALQHGPIATRIFYTPAVNKQFISKAQFRPEQTLALYDADYSQQNVFIELTRYVSQRQADKPLDVYHISPEFPKEHRHYVCVGRPLWSRVYQSEIAEALKISS